jgi:hypothetical protein
MIYSSQNNMSWFEDLTEKIIYHTDCNGWFSFHYFQRLHGNMSIRLAGGWCWFILREKYCWLVAGGWFVLREKYWWLMADKPKVLLAGGWEKSTANWFVWEFCWGRDGRHIISCVFLKTCIAHFFIKNKRVIREPLRCGIISKHNKKGNNHDDQHGQRNTNQRKTQNYQQHINLREKGTSRAQAHHRQAHI